MKLRTSIALICCLALTLTLPGCTPPVTVLKLRAIKTSSDTSDTVRERETGKSSKPALRIKEAFSNHAGPPGPGNAEGYTRTYIRFEVQNRGDEIWTLKATECKFSVFSYVNQDEDTFSVTDESGVVESLPYPNKTGDAPVDEFLIKPEETVGSSLGFKTKGYDFCVLVLPFDSETGESLVFELLYSAKRLPRKTIDKFKSGLDT